MNTMHKSAGLLQQAGRNGDTILAHINPQEAALLKAVGGSGTINPKTGLPEFGFWTSIRDAFQSIAVVVGNYFLPGSSLVTGKLVSKGSQEQLGSTIGQIATMASGVTGGAAGNLSNYGKLLNQVGLNGITNGIDSVTSWMSKTLDTLSGSAAQPGAIAETASTLSGDAVDSGLGKAAGNVAGTDSVAKAASEQAGLTVPKAVDVVAAANAPPTAKPGILKRAMGWAEKNPTSALMVGQTIAAGIGGMGTAEANREAAQLNRQTQLEMPGIQKKAGMVQGGMGQLPFQAADPSQMLTQDGRYMYGPMAGQYAPGRGPGIINQAMR